MLSSHKRTHEFIFVVFISVPNALDSSYLFILFIFHRQNSSWSVYAIDLEFTLSYIEKGSEASSLGFRKL